MIQLPAERGQHVEATVIAGLSSEGSQVLRVKFQDETGRQVIYDDHLATIVFPNHAFAIGEKVHVKVFPDGHCCVEQSFLERWRLTFFLISMALLAFFLSLGYHLRSLLLAKQ